jgi:hypothetical protein
VVEHLTHTNFNPMLVHQTFNAYANNTTRENNLYVHISPTTGEASASSSSSSHTAAHPAATRQIANDLEIHHAGKRPKKEEIVRTPVPVAPPVSEDVPMEENKAQLKQKADAALAATAAKKPREMRAIPIEDTPAPPPDKKAKAEKGKGKDTVKEQVKPEPKEKAKAKAKASAKEPKEERVKEPRGRKKEREPPPPLAIQDRSRSRARGGPGSTSTKQPAIEDRPGPSPGPGPAKRSVSRARAPVVTPPEPKIPEDAIVAHTRAAGNTKKKVTIRSTSEPPVRKGKGTKGTIVAAQAPPETKKSTVKNKKKAYPFTVVAP